MSELIKEDECIYAILGVPCDASAELIAKQYRKQSLLFHPDRHSGKDEKAIADATHKFQRLGLVYSVLSDPKRREQYDRTGSLNELEISVDDYDAVFRSIYNDVVTPEAIENFKKEYQGSEEEKTDLFAAYNLHRGDMQLIMEEIPCSTVMDDEKRFRKIIEDAIADNTAEPFEAFTQETEEKRALRLSEAQEEAKEAEDTAMALGLDGTDDSLRAIIQQRQQTRKEELEGFLQRVENVPELPEQPSPASDSNQVEEPTPKKRGRAKAEPPAPPRRSARQAAARERLNATPAKTSSPAPKTASKPASKRTKKAEE